LGGKLLTKKKHPRKIWCEYADQFSFLDFIIFILFIFSRNEVATSLK